MSANLSKIIIFVLISIFVFSGCDSKNNYNADLNYEWEIKYEVIVKDSYGWNKIYGIEYNDETNAIIWVGNSPESPWAHEFKTDQDDYLIYIRAIPMMCDGYCPDFSLSVTANIYIDNELYISKTDPSEVTIDDNIGNLLADAPTIYVNQNIHNIEVLEYHTGISGDEENAIIVQQAINYEISELIKDANNEHEIIYAFKPETGYVGLEEIILQIEQGSDGVHKSEQITTIYLSINITA